MSTNSDSTGSSGTASDSEATVIDRFETNKVDDETTTVKSRIARFPESVENLCALATAASSSNEEDPSMSASISAPMSNGPNQPSTTTTTTTTTTESSCTNTTSMITKVDDSVLFNQISYIGCSRIENPNSETDMLKIVTLLNAEKAHNSIDAILAIPSTSAGIVRLLDATTRCEIATFAVHRIRFCARGQPQSSERECFAFSFTQQNGTVHDPAIHQCHVFRCQMPDAAGKALLCFATAFRNSSTMSTADIIDSSNQQQMKYGAGGASAVLSGNGGAGVEEDYQFEEEDAKKGFTLCPQEKNCFKLRRDREKRVVVVLRQLSGPRTLAVRKCFGLLLAAGRNLRHSDMHLLDMQSMGRGNDNRVYIIEALWDPNAQNFEVLNTETPRETRVFMTIAADVILSGIDEPVRFNIECKARIFHQHERFWYVTRKAIVERYFLTIRKNELSGSVDNVDKVVRFESMTERERTMTRLSLGRSPTKMATQLIHPADDDESDSDEPLLSGSGDVNRECSANMIAEWAELLEKWRVDTQHRPKELAGLIRNDGVPDVLRGEVWQLLTGVQNDVDVMDTYRLLLGKECPSEQTIQRDIHRTFPAHDYFKEAGGVGQEALYKISKAYSLYDEEVGYCQGLSFLGASLLLHMPEEQAFCVLVKIMFEYNLRDLFKLGFDVLHLRFYQLHRLIEDYIPDLFAHFYDIGVETHMFASQWFLTLFTAKFPLQMVFFIVDLFLSEGMNTIFHISLALLKASKKDLLQLDFEGVLKYFRVTLPRKYRTESNAKELIQQAVKLRISQKRTAKYEKDYIALKQKELESQDPIERLERENLRLKETILRLERENDDLAHELVTSKIELRKNLDAAEDNVESLQTQLERATRTAKDLDDENRNLHAEYDQVKDMCRRELQKLESESSRDQSIITNYKQICTDLSYKLEQSEKKYVKDSRNIQRLIAGCEPCTSAFTEVYGTIDGKISSPVIDASCNALEIAARLDEREEHIRQIELELAQTKLALVESQCRNQDLSHQMNYNNSSTATAIVGSSATADRGAAWLKKTISSIKEVGTSLK